MEPDIIFRAIIPEFSKEEALEEMENNFSSLPKRFLRPLINDEIISYEDGSTVNIKVIMYLPHLSESVMKTKTFTGYKCFPNKGTQIEDINEGPSVIINDIDYDSEIILPRSSICCYNPFDALNKKHFKCLETCMKQSSEPILNNYGWPLGRVAVGCVESLKFLDSIGYDFNQLSSNGCCDMGVAAYNDYDSLVFLTEKLGIDPMFTDDREETLLMGACQNGQVKCVSYLLENAKFDVNAVNYCGETASHFAIECESFEILKMLVDNGADLNTKDKCGNTLVHMGSRNLPILEYLHSKDIDMDSSNNYRMTPLMKASQSGSIDSVRFLTKCNIDPSKLDEQERSAAVFSCYNFHSSVEHQECFYLLAKLGMSLKGCDILYSWMPDDFDFQPLISVVKDRKDFNHKELQSSVKSIPASPPDEAELDPELSTDMSMGELFGRTDSILPSSLK